MYTNTYKYTKQYSIFLTLSSIFFSTRVHLQMIDILSLSVLIAPISYQQGYIPGNSLSRIPRNLADFSFQGIKLHSREFPGNFCTMNFDKLTKKLNSNESDFMRKFLAKIRKCKKTDPNTSKNLVITCVLHISPIKSINHSPPP